MRSATAGASSLLSSLSSPGLVLKIRLVRWCRPITAFHQVQKKALEYGAADYAGVLYEVSGLVGSLDLTTDPKDIRVRADSNEARRPAFFLLSTTCSAQAWDAWLCLKSCCLSEIVPAHPLCRSVARRSTCSTSARSTSRSRPSGGRSGSG